MSETTNNNMYPNPATTDDAYDYPQYVPPVKVVRTQQENDRFGKILFVISIIFALLCLAVSVISGFMAGIDFTETSDMTFGAASGLAAVLMVFNTIISATGGFVLLILNIIALVMKSATKLSIISLMLNIFLFGLVLIAFFLTTTILGY